MIDLDEIERIARLGVPLGLSVEQLRRIVAQRHAGMLEMVAELRDSRIGDDERTRLQFRASLAEHQRNDALRRVAELEAQLASADMAVSHMMDDFEEDGTQDAIAEAIGRHWARQGLEP